MYYVLWVGLRNGKATAEKLTYSALKFIQSVNYIQVLFICEINVEKTRENGR